MKFQVGDRVISLDDAEEGRTGIITKITINDIGDPTFWVVYDGWIPKVLDDPYPYDEDELALISICKRKSVV